MAEENILTDASTDSGAATLTGSQPSPPTAAETPADGGIAPNASAAGTDGAPLPPYPGSDQMPAAGSATDATVPGTAGETSSESLVPAPAAPPDAAAPAAPPDGTVPAPAAFPQPVSPEELTPAMGTPQSPGGEMSVKDMFLHADPVVQGVMLLLLLASVATWVIIFEKTFIFRSTSRRIMLFKRAAARDDLEITADDFPPLTRPIVEAGIRESRDAAGGEARCDYRERVERSMRAELSGLMDRIGYRVMFLATVGAVSPFVGLFGTVWGIMHSFVGIAASGETTLAVVAPGIAEALFATAMGLVAAIPAVIAYNKITGTMKKITKEALSGIGFLGNRLARRHFAGLKAER